MWTVQYFLNHYGEVNKKNLSAYKVICENFKPQTVNLRLQGINKYLESQNKRNWKWSSWKGTIEELFGKCNKRCRLQFLVLSAQSRWLWWVVFHRMVYGCYRARQRTIYIKAEHIQIVSTYTARDGKIRCLYILKQPAHGGCEIPREIGLTSGLHLSELVWQRITTRK